MTQIYRLATVQGAEGPNVVIERGGRAIPLLSILQPEDVQRLGARPLTDILPLLDDWAHWDPVLEARATAAGDKFSSGKNEAELSFLAPIALPRKIICVGANYYDHIAEMGIPMAPSYPYSFLKPASTLTGSGKSVAKPNGVVMFDWEAELAAIIGTRCRNVAAADALDVVAGYSNFNDLSARDWIEKRPPIGVDWVRHKGFDGFGPMGPWFVPAEFAGDPTDMPVFLSVNGVTKQDSNTNQMVFGVAQIIEHLSSIMTLEPGDVIATGTPAGVGHGRKPPEFLNPGDEVRIEIGKLGVLVTPIIA